MKDTRLMGLVIVVSALAMAALTPTVALATQGTALCKVHESSCKVENLVTHVHGSSSAPLFLSEVVNLTCESSLFDGWVSNPSEEPDPQVLHIEKLTWTGCVLGGFKLPCTLTTEDFPNVDFSRTALNLAAIAILEIEVRIRCELAGKVYFNCPYSFSEEGKAAFEGALHTGSAGNGKVTVAGVPMAPVEGGFCLNPFLMDAVYEVSEHVYVTAESQYTSPNGTALCDVHEEPCGKEDLTTSLHLVGTEAVRLLSGLTEVTCAGSLLGAAVLTPGDFSDPQPIDVEALTWSECKSKGSGTNNCEVKTEALPVIELKLSSLNLGTASMSNGEVRFKCVSGKLTKIDCLFSLQGDLSVEGALHVEGAGNGVWRVSKQSIEPLEGFCPESAEWDAKYAPLNEAYIVRTMDGPVEGTALCTALEATCEGKNQVSSLHLTAAAPVRFLISGGAVSFVKCPQSLMTASVAGLASAPEQQVVTVKEISWKSCTTLVGGEANCTITNEESLVFDVLNTKFNYGVATGLGGRIHLKCTVGGFIKLDCTYSGKGEMGLEGAFRSPQAGKGMLTASKVPLKVVGGVLCPEETTLDALYEPSEPVFITS